MTAMTPALEALLRAVRILPWAPRLLAEARALLANPNSDLDAVVVLLKRDAALTADIVRISNSAVYAGAEPCGSLEGAVARVGYAELYRLIGFAATAHLCPQTLELHGVTGAQFRENALLVALTMEQIAPVAQLDAANAYTAGLLRSIGKVAINRLAESRTGIGYATHGDGPLADWERAVVGLGNDEAAGMILREWHFPAEIADAVRQHYRSSTASPLGCALHLAAAAAERCGHGWPGERYYWDDPQPMLRALGLDEEQVDAAMRNALEQFGPVRAAVG